MEPNSDNRLARLIDLGQSLWLDNIQRSGLENGEIQTLIDRGEIRGITSNPSIFEHAISSTRDYHEAIRSLAWSGWDAEKIYWELVVEDVRSALDLFLPIYEQSNGSDGFVSVEVSPLLADDTAGTVAQAQQLWARIRRPNLMVKIPATQAGLPAIRASVAAGLNINVTLIFSRRRYAGVLEAYLSGLEDRLATGRSLAHIASVASFFVSRVDSKIDARLHQDSPFRGKAAIANAKLAYQDFRRTFRGERWERLERAGARPQKPLWASTSTKDPAYPDTRYVDELIGPDTVNTVPASTLKAARQRARIAVTVETGLDDARQTLAALAQQGIEIEAIATELEAEGARAFAAALQKTIEHLESARQLALKELGGLAAAVSQRIAVLAAEGFLERFCDRDPGLWSDTASGQTEVRQRLGWIDSPQKAMTRLPVYRQFATDLRAEGTTRVLVLGMGGSSLAAEVIGSVFPGDRAAGGPRLGILDSTDPGQVAQAARDFPPSSSMYVVSSKSGGTAEVMAAFEYFWKITAGDGSRFIAITDAGTTLQALAREQSFRATFTADSTVGGRYSALTDFGMIPAALLEIDLDRFLGSAVRMQHQCKRDLPTGRNPGVALGALLGAAALSGTDKLTLLADPEIEALPHWIEQLVAESSGKDGKGILPVASEPLDSPQVYDSDRLFVYLRSNGRLDSGVRSLLQAGFPVITLDLPDSYAVAGEFYRWEVAIATACHIIGVNAFDQPDVQESKDRTQAKIEVLRTHGVLDEGKWDMDLSVEVDRRYEGRKLWAFLHQVVPAGYVALNAYLPRRDEVIAELQRIRVLIRERTHLATTAGFGPRFQHSTGQLHKGGPNTGLFLQLVSEPEVDLRIPGSQLTFGGLIRAQALGDYETLVARHRRVFRIHLSRPQDVVLLRRFLNEPVG